MISGNRMLNLKSYNIRFAALTALLGFAFMMPFSLRVCVSQDKELVGKTVKTLGEETGQENLIPYRKSERWGFSDSNKKLVIQPKYDKAYPFSEGLAVVEVD